MNLTEFTYRFQTALLPEDLILPTSFIEYGRPQRNLHIPWKDLEILKIYAKGHEYTPNNHKFSPPVHKRWSHYDEITLLMHDYLNSVLKILLHQKKEPKNILDIGSGIGIVDFMLYSFYKRRPKFTFLDKNATTRDLDTWWREKQFKSKISKGKNFLGDYYENSADYVFYNDSSISRDIIETNEYDENNFLIIDDGNSNHIPKDERFDLIISTWSCGWHYGLETYIDLIKEKISPGGSIFLTMRDPEDIQKIESKISVASKSVFIIPDAGSNAGKYRGGYYLSLQVAE